MRPNEKPIVKPKKQAPKPPANASKEVKAKALAKAQTLHEAERQKARNARRAQSIKDA
jgi:hypothetical protein